MSQRFAAKRSMRRAARNMLLFSILLGGALLLMIGFAIPGIVVVGVLNDDRKAVSVQIELAQTSIDLAIPAGESRYAVRRFDGAGAVGLNGHPACAESYLPNRSVSLRWYSLRGTDCVRRGVRLTNEIILAFTSVFVLVLAAIAVHRVRQADH